jgi:hypothetical protein
MSFLHTWPLMVGMFALGAPLAVHFLTRPRPLPYSLSTLRFVREIIEQRRARSRLRDWIVLLLRALAVALLALAVAQPLPGRKPVIQADPRPGTARVIVLDLSQSMAAGAGGTTAISAARVAALRYLDLAPDVEAGLVLASAQPSAVFDQLSSNFAALREAVRQSSVRPEQASTRGALTLAARLLAARPAASRELILISDFQRSNWGSLQLDGLPAGTSIQFHSVAVPALANVAITAVRCPSPASVGRPAWLEVDLANHSSQAQSVRCQLEIGGHTQNWQAELQPNSARTLTAQVIFEEAGWLHGWARLQGNQDALPEDDTRPMVIQVRPPPRALLLTQQSAAARPSSSYYLEQVLGLTLDPRKAAGAAGAAGGAAGDSAAVSRDGARPVTRLHPQQTSVTQWPESELFVLDHCGPLERGAVERIAAQVRRGAGLLFVLSDLTDAVNLEQLAGALGAGFQPPVTPLVDHRGPRRDLLIRHSRNRQPPFEILGGNPVGLRTVRISGGMATRPLETGLRDQVLAELSDSSALLYLTGADAGQVAVLNADLGQSNWCVQPTFLPVVAEVMHALLAGKQQALEAVCGEPMVRLLPPEVARDAQLQVRVADRQSQDFGLPGKWEWSDSQSAMAWHWPSPPGPGIYELRSGERCEWSVATALPAAESDLQALDPSTLALRMAADRAAGYADPDSEDTAAESWWSWLIVACALGLIGEIAALRWFRA